MDPGGRPNGLKITSQKPLKLYRAINEPMEPGFRQNGVFFRHAVRRCRDHIATHIQPLFGDNRHIRTAIRSLTYLVENSTGSGMPDDLDYPLQISNSQIPRLSFSQCAFIFQNFNAYSPLSEGDRNLLGPILFPTMAAAVSGAYKVVEYLKDEGRELKISRELENFDREVWLRDCVTKLPLI
jgi:hypothetical protein